MKNTESIKKKMKYLVEQDEIHKNIKHIKTLHNK